ncbi:EamA family transporter [Rothia sp. AR01]|uniref:EamA family transporter n=1 Tax=Rothia santali TaxID=2949643 RepID=A0A9X2HGI9_9MICC|nr:EamA family transporter [Rothia santali]MCP3426317.1 EamA family transporter [Rothia santali]
MPASTLLMVLLAAVLRATWNLAAKAKRGDSYVFVWWYAVLGGVVMLPLGALEVVRSGGFDRYDPALWWAPAVSAALHMGYNLALQTGYERAPLSTVYPTARGTGPVITMLVAILVLGERPGWLAAGGALLIVGGIVLAAVPPLRRVGAASRAAAVPGPSSGPGVGVATGPGSAPNVGAAPGPGSAPNVGAPRARRGAEVRGHRGAARRATLAGVGWGSATGLFIAGYTLWDDHAVTALGQLPLSYFAVCSLYQAVLMTAGMNRRRWALAGTTLRRNLWPTAAVVVLSPAAYILVLTAMQTQPVSLVAPLRETSIVVGTLLAWLLFKEAAPVQRLLGATVVVGGVALIAA